LGDSVVAGDVLRLVGFGCNNIDSKRGAGVKRTGTNAVAKLSSYIEFLTPASESTGYGARGIIGPSNRAGSCFGDSGGPALKAVGDAFVVVASPRGGPVDEGLISEYVNVATRTDNRSFISQLNTEHDLGIQGL